MIQNGRERNDPVTAAVFGFILPGGGHLYGGRFGKAVFFFVLIVGTFLAGLFLSGFRGVSLEHQPYWFLGQVFAGLPAIVAALLSPDWKSVRIGAALDTGTLYTTIAGLLNILVILDAAFPASIRLLFNLPGDEEVKHPLEFFEKMKSTPDTTSVLAGFSSMSSAMKALKSLSFVEEKSGKVDFPKGMRGGLFKTSSGAVLVFGGSVSETQRAEISGLFGKRAREMTVTSPDGKEESLRKPWWRI